MARPPIDWKKKYAQLELNFFDLLSNRAGLERLAIEKSNYLDKSRQEASEFKEQVTKYKGVIEYLEKHIDLLNEKIEELRAEKEKK
jgi:hypothetical protein